VTIENFVAVLAGLAFVSMAGHVIAGIVLTVGDESVPPFLMITGALSGFVFGSGVMLL
jgi:hypothetical protein